jgi:hypothetical protein
VAANEEEAEEDNTESEELATTSSGIKLTALGFLRRADQAE